MFIADWHWMSDPWSDEWRTHCDDGEGSSDVRGTQWIVRDGVREESQARQQGIQDQPRGTPHHRSVPSYFSNSLTIYLHVVLFNFYRGYRFQLHVFFKTLYSRRCWSEISVYPRLGQVRYGGIRRSSASRFVWVQAPHPKCSFRSCQGPAPVAGAPVAFSQQADCCNRALVAFFPLLTFQ